MKLLIESAVVYKNIKLFKQIVQKHLHDQRFHFNAYVNRKTGEILFEEEVQNIDKLHLKQYKSLCLNLSQEASHPGFEILEEKSNESLFDCKDLTPLARHILAEMISALNRIVFESPHPENSEEVLKEVSQAELEAPMPKHLEKDIVHEAWHEASRIEAEKLLEHKAIGTYFFRKDEYAALLEEQLSSRWREPIKCLTLTYLEPHDKVRDLTLVGKEGHWYLYDDDPTLEDTAYSDIPTLLKRLRSDLSEPLLFEESA